MKDTTTNRGAPDKKRLTRIIKYGLGIGLLAALVFSLDTQELVSVLRQARLQWVIITIFAALILFDFQGWLLGMLTSPFAKIPHLHLLGFTLIGRFFSLFLPSSIGGDLVKGIYLFPYFERRSQAYAAIVMQRAIGGLATFAVAFIAAFLFLPPSYIVPLVVGAAAMGAGGLVALIVYYRFKRRIWNQIRHHETLNGNSRGLTGMVYRLLAAVLAYDHVRFIVALTFVLSTAATLLSVGLYILLAQTLQIPLTFKQALVASTITNLSVILPLTPGGIGVGEGTFVVTAGVMGVPAEHALAIMLLGRIIAYITALPGGVLYMALPDKKLR